MLDIGGGFIPGIQISGGDLDIFPHITAFKDILIFLNKHSFIHFCGDIILHLRRGRPNIFQVDRLTILAYT